MRDTSSVIPICFSSSEFVILRNWKIGVAYDLIARDNKISYLAGNILIV